MVDPINILTIISVILTFIGSYRFLSFTFKDDPVLVGMIATGLTITYIVAFEFIIMTIGLMMLLVPITAFYRRNAIKESVRATFGVGSGQTSQSSRSGQSSTAGQGTANSSTSGTRSGKSQSKECPECGTTRTPGERFCHICHHHFSKNDTSSAKKP
jgi:uncharacterized membrane protein YgcG